MESPLHACFEADCKDKENQTPGKMKTFKIAGSSKLSPFSTPGNKNKSFRILSDDEISQGKVTSNGKKPRSAKRHGLSTLQESSDQKGTLVGKGREIFPVQDSFFKKNCKKPNVSLQDEPKDMLAEEAIALMKATEVVDDSYWKSLAEERRAALEEVLTENEKLFDKIDSLTAENTKLKNKLNEAECFKILYESLKEQIQISEQKQS